MLSPDRRTIFSNSIGLVNREAPGSEVGPTGTSRREGLSLTGVSLVGFGPDPVGGVADC